MPSCAAAERLATYVVVRSTAKFLKSAFEKFGWKETTDAPLTKLITITDYPSTEPTAFDKAFEDIGDGTMRMRSFPVATRDTVANLIAAHRRGAAAAVGGEEEGGEDPAWLKDAGAGRLGSGRAETTPLSPA
jgi:hypothetical protein